MCNHVGACLIVGCMEHTEGFSHSDGTPSHVKRCRLLQGLSQAQLGQLAGGLDRRTIGRIERSETQPRIATAAGIARGLNLPLAAAFPTLAGCEEMPTRPPQVATASIDYFTKVRAALAGRAENAELLADTQHLVARCREGVWPL